MKKREAFISLKDHKKSFENNPKSRLINPAENDFGKINKLILDKVNTSIQSILNVNQWRNGKKVFSFRKESKTTTLTKSKPCTYVLVVQLCLTIFNGEVFARRKVEVSM